MTKSGNIVIEESSRDTGFFFGIGSRLFVRSCGEFHLVPPDRERIKTPDFAELFWPVSGRGTFILDGRPHDLLPGAVWYYPPGAAHNYYPLSTFHYCWLTLSGPGCGELFGMLGISPGLNPAGLCPLHLFRSVRIDLESESVEKRMKALADAFKILTMVEASRAAGRVNSSLAGVEEYIDGNCGDAGLTVSSLADLYGMDRSSFSRAFRRRCGCSVKQYITDCRLKKAAGLLTGTNLSLARISSECGMRSAHYFAKVFSARTGMSPGVFRRRSCASAGAVCGKLIAELRGVRQTPRPEFSLSGGRKER